MDHDASVLLSSTVLRINTKLVIHKPLPEDWPQSPLEADREALISSSLFLVVLTNSITSVSKQNCSKTRCVVILYKGWIRGLLDYLSVLGTGWLPRWFSGKESTCQCRRPRKEDSPGGGNGNPLRYSCWENPMDWGAWQVTIHRVSKSQAQVSTRTHARTSTHWKL